MPTGEIKKLSKESHKPIKEIETMWQKLQKEAQNNHIKNKYAYAVGTLEKVYGNK